MTPSERAQALINPNIRTRTLEGQELKIITFLKTVLGTPIPWLLSCAMLVAPLGESVFEIVTGVTAALILGYILVDRISPVREFPLRWSPSDLLLAGLCVINLLNGLRAPGENLTLLIWPFLVFLLSFGLDLFPGLNRRLWSLMVIAPFVALFILWQRLVGANMDAPFLPPSLVESLNGIRTVGLFENAGALTLIMASLMGFLTATFFTAEENEDRILALLAALGLACCWLALVTLGSGGALIVGLSAILLVLLFYNRVFFGLVTVICAILYLSPSASELPGVNRLSYWIEKGSFVTEQKRLVAQRQVEIFQQNPLIGEGMTSSVVSPVSSNLYLDILRGGGMLTFILFMLTALTFLLKTQRLRQETPSTHAWHKAFMSGLLSAQVSFLVLGLFQSLLAISFSWIWLAVVWSMIHYIDSCYAKGLVPDDSSI